MKKAVVTIGLLSLVLVVTSFTTPEEVKNIASNDLDISYPIDGTSMGRRKSDNVGYEKQMESNFKQSSSFATENQSTRMTVKLD